MIAFTKSQSLWVCLRRTGSAVVCTFLVSIFPDAALTQAENVPPPPISAWPPEDVASNSPFFGDPLLRQSPGDMSPGDAARVLSAIIDNNIRALEYYRNEDQCHVILAWHRASGLGTRELLSNLRAMAVQDELAARWAEGLTSNYLERIDRLLEECRQVERRAQTDEQDVVEVPENRGPGAGTSAADVWAEDARGGVVRFTTGSSDGPDGPAPPTGEQGTEPLPPPPISTLPVPLDEISPNEAQEYFWQIMARNVRAYEYYVRHDRCDLRLAFADREFRDEAENLLYDLLGRFNSSYKEHDVLGEHLERVSELINHSECRHLAVQVPGRCVGTRWVVYRDGLEIYLRGPLPTLSPEAAPGQGWEDVVTDFLQQRSRSSAGASDIPDTEDEEASSDSVTEDEKRAGESSGQKGVRREISRIETSVARPLQETTDESDSTEDRQKNGNAKEVSLPATPEADIPQPAQSKEEPEPNLGKVKATAEVIALSIASAATGAPVTGVGVKFLPDEPPLPGSQHARPSPDGSEVFDQDAFFEADAEGGFTNEGGQIELASSVRQPSDVTGDRASPRQVATSDGPHVEETQGSQSNTHRTTVGIPDSARVTLEIETEPTDGVVVGLKEPSALAKAIESEVLASLVSNAFTIGSQSIVQLVVPRKRASELSTHLSSQDWVSWFEPDPCWSKQDVKASHESGIRAIAFMR